MRLLADLHIAPRTVEFLRTLGHDVVQVTDLLPANASDKEIVERAAQERRTILTQDLDFSSIIALSGRRTPSLLFLRLSSSKIEMVNAVLQRTLPVLESDLEQGAIITVEDQRTRLRRLHWILSSDARAEPPGVPPVYHPDFPPTSFGHVRQITRRNTSWQVVKESRRSGCLTAAACRVGFAKWNTERPA